MAAAARTSWIPAAVVLGVGYALTGILFAVPATHVHTWRRAAWVVSAALYAAHLAYERFRLHSSGSSSALHVAAGVALGAFGLAAGANIHSLSIGSSEHQRLLLLALAIWPVMTAMPAFAIALGVNFVSGRAFGSRTLKIGS